MLVRKLEVQSQRARRVRTQRSSGVNVEVLRALLLERGWSVAQFASEVRACTRRHPGADLGATRSTISRALAGQAVLLGTVRTLAAALDVPVLHLLRPAARKRAATRPTAFAAGFSPPPEPPAGGLCVLDFLEAQFAKRFDGLRGLVLAAVRRGEITPSEYYRQEVWLQFDQFRAWRDGRLRRETYRFWMTCRRREWTEDGCVGGVSYREAWTAELEHIDDARFSAFMARVFGGEIDGAMREASLDTA